MYVGPSDTVSSQFDIFEVSEDMTYTPLTLDEYDIDINNDVQIQEEFPVLKAGMTKTQTSNKPEQSEAQKEATRLLRQKFKYPAQDPPPNDFQDTRTELQKIQSILRISSQILDQENLEIWNRVCERSLHLVRQNNSGIPLLRQDISDQIKTYRLQKQQEEDLLQQTETLNNLRVNKYSELSDKSLVTPSKADSHLSLIDPEASEAPSTPVTDIDCLTTIAAPLPSQNMSTILYNLWDNSTYSGCRNRRLPNLLKSDRYLFDSAVQIILSHLTSNRVMKKYTKYWGDPSYRPNQRACKKVAKLLVKYKVVGNELLRTKPININANLADSDANVHCLMNGLHMTCCADTGAHNSIISDQTFNDLNLDKTSLDTQQRYNIKTATSLELDAVQGVIIVPLVFFN